MKYTIFNKKKEATELACRIGIDPNTALFLINRGITDEKEIIDFLYGEDLLDSSDIYNIHLVLPYIKEAIINQHNVCIYGDYDCDGITSVAILYIGLLLLNINVFYKIPDRLTEGYGMNINAIQEIHKQGCDLLITVDNGIKNIQEIEYAKNLGMSVIVLDHHEPDVMLPNADVIVDLHQDNETYKYKDLAGCGLAFKVLLYIYEQLGEDTQPVMELIDLAAIGTIADVVPLTGENRAIVKRGLKFINSKEYKRPGIKALLQLSNQEGEVSSSDIAFGIAPILNAPGRLLENGANLSLDLLLSNIQDADDIALRAIEINEKRKLITSERMKQALEYIKENNLENDSFLVVYLPDIEHGVIGLIAGRLTELYNRPSLVFTDDKNGKLKASGRSNKEINLYESLLYSKDLLLKFGGHPEAVGLSIADKNILPDLHERLNGYLHAFYGNKFDKKYEVDMEIELKDINAVLLRSIKNLEPYGEKNPCPLFYIKDFNTRIKQTTNGYKHYQLGGVDNQHVKIFGQDYKENVYYNANGFNLSNQYLSIGSPRKLNIIFSIDEYRCFGRETKQLILKDFEIGNERIVEIPLLQTSLKDALSKL